MSYSPKRKPLFQMFLIMMVFLSAITVISSCSSAPTSIPPITTPSGTLPLTSTPANNDQTSPTSSRGTSVGAIISWSLNPPTLKSGESFVANLVLDSKVPLRGAQWSMSYNPQTLRCDKFTEGNIFKDWAISHGGQTVVFPQPQIDNSAGRVSDMGIAIMSSQPGGATGNGIICVYNFTALADNPVLPQLSNVQVIDENAKSVNVSIKSQ